MFQNYVWILANPILDFVGRNPRYSRGDLMFLTLDLLPSENMQIYNRGKPKPFPSVCSAHSFSELLTTPVGWLSCCLAPLACVWGDGGRVPAHLVMRDSVPMWGSLSSPTVEEKKGTESWKWELPPRLDNLHLLVRAPNLRELAQLWSASGSSNPEEKWYLGVFVLEM